jgi:hypothetical protein
MIKTCERCGLNYPASGKHNCSIVPPKAANENEEKILLWRRGYMRDYMYKRRLRQTAMEADPSAGDVQRAIVLLKQGLDAFVDAMTGGGEAEWNRFLSKVGLAQRALRLVSDRAYPAATAVIDGGVVANQEGREA